jgi:hypothetical protein
MFQIESCYCRLLFSFSQLRFIAMKSSYESSHWPVAHSLPQVKDVEIQAQAPAEPMAKLWYPSHLFSSSIGLSLLMNRRRCGDIAVSARIPSEREHFRASSLLQEAGGPTGRLYEDFQGRLLLRLDHTLSTVHFSFRTNLQPSVYFDVHVSQPLLLLLLQAHFF